MQSDAALQTHAYMHHAHAFYMAPYAVYASYA